MTADNQHFRLKLKHNISKKLERDIENRAVTIERSRSIVTDSASTSTFWQEEDEHIKTSIASNKIVIIPTGITATTL